MKTCKKFILVFLLHVVSRGYAFASPVDSVRIVGWRVFSDNINFDGRINPGENVRYGITIHNGTTTPLEVYVTPSNDSLLQHHTFFVPAGGQDSMVYDPDQSYSYFHFTAASVRTTETIRYTLVAYENQNWADSITFPIVPFQFPVERSAVSHTTGRSEWEFDVLVVNPTATQNHQYEITIDSLMLFRKDSLMLFTKGITLRDITSGTTLLSRLPITDKYLHNIPIVQGFKITGGRNFDSIGMRRDSTRWISASPQWVNGDGRFSYYPYSALSGGVILGGQFESPYFERNPESSFDLTRAYTTEVRFDSTRPQKAYRLRRIGQYLIQDFVNVPFSVWDMRNGRQLTLSWRDQNNSGTWDPPVSYSNVEVIFVYDKSYDSTGTTQFRMPPNAIPNEATKGPKADFVYLMSLAIVSGHVRNESLGTLYLRPIYALNESDRFTFNPTILLSVLQEGLPEDFALYQNYPNPFNPTTTIKYQLSTQSKVTIKIFNLLGQEVKTLIDGVENAGEHQLQWDGKNNFGVGVATGVYFYRIETNGIGSGKQSFSSVKKMLLLR